MENNMKNESVSCLVMSDSMIPWTVACQAPLSVEFSKQEYWSGLLCPLPRDLPNTGIKPCLLHFLHWQVSSLLLMPIKHSKKAKQNKIEAENSPFLRALCSAQHRPNLTF